MIREITNGFLRDLLTIARDQAQLPDAPEALRRYATKTDEADLIEDIRDTVEWLKGSASLPENALTESLGEFLIKDFGPVLDGFDAAFYLLSDDERASKIPSAFGGAALMDALRHILSTNSYHAITKEAQEFVRTRFQTEPLIVQVARELEPAQKARIRSTLLESEPKGFPVFHIEKQLLGGMRLFQNGKMVDASWQNRVQSLLA